MRQVLLGKALLGQGQGGGVSHQADFGAPPYYLLNDVFATDRAAGAVNGTDAEPGPGARAVTDTNSKLSLSSGIAVFAAGGVGNGNPGLYYGPFARGAGRIFFATITTTTSTMTAGWDENTGGQITSCVRFIGSSTTLTVRVNLVSLTVGTFSTGIAYQVAVILRALGSFYFIKGGAFTDWTLLWGSDSEGTSPMIPALVVESSATVAAADNVIVPAARWVPEPLISDGFSILGQSDGLGHQEGIAGGLGSGGDGVTWTDELGAWAVTGGKLGATAVGDPIAVAIRLADCGETDIMVTANISALAGVSTSIVVRWVDISNHIVIRHSGSLVQLIKVVSGSATVLVNIATTYVDGAPLRLIVQGTKFRCFYNNVAVGTEQTISDAGLQASTTIGVLADSLNTRFDNLVAYARGSGGEYAQLDMVANWYGAGGRIDAANLLEAVESPSADTAYGGDGVTDGQPWTLAMRATWDESDVCILFSSGDSDALYVGDVTANGAGQSGVLVDATWYITDLLVAADAVYMLVCDGAQIVVYRDNAQVGVIDNSAALQGAEMVWLGLYSAPSTYAWTGDCPAVAAYDIALDAAQRAALYSALAGI